MKYTTIAVMSLFLSGCVFDKYIVKYPDFDMPEEPVYQRVQDNETVVKTERTVGKNLVQCIGYSKKLKNVLDVFKEEADSSTKEINK